MFKDTAIVDGFEASFVNGFDAWKNTRIHLKKLNGKFPNQ
jgi:hypothetical protein